MAGKKKGRSAKKPTVPGADEYLAELVKLRGKGDPEDFAFFSDALFGSPKERMPTGILELDKFTGGGYPVGRIIEVAGWEGSGKSTLIDQGIAQCQKMDGIAHLIDNCEGRDATYTKTLGVDIDKLITDEIETLEEGFTGIDKILTVQEKKEAELHKAGIEPPLTLIAWDSLGGTPSDAEFEGAADDDHVATGAKVINLNFKRILSRLAKLRVVFIFANHFYKTIGQGISTLVTYGGKGVRYYPSIRLWIRRTDEIKVSNRTVGFQVEAKLRKTKVGRWNPPTTLGLVHSCGIDNSWSLFRWGKDHGIGGDYPNHRWIEQRGAWCYLVPPGYETITFQNSFIGLGEVLAENPEIYQDFIDAFMADNDA
jgi:recombination protein RecA